MLLCFLFHTIISDCIDTDLGWQERGTKSCVLWFLRCPRCMVKRNRIFTCGLPHNTCRPERKPVNRIPTNLPLHSNYLWFGVHLCVQRGLIWCLEKCSIYHTLPCNQNVFLVHYPTFCFVVDGRESCFHSNCSCCPIKKISVISHPVVLQTSILRHLYM